MCFIFVGRLQGDREMSGTAVNDVKHPKNLLKGKERKEGKKEKKKEKFDMVAHTFISALGKQSKEDL